jgi:hypothetical protein
MKENTEWAWYSCKIIVLIVTWSSIEQTDCPEKGGTKEDHYQQED